MVLVVTHLKLDAVEYAKTSLSHWCYRYCWERGR